MKRVALAGGLVILAFSGAYVFIYLYRWEWNRALIAAALFIATEVAVGVAVLLERLRQMKTLLETDRPSPEARARARAELRRNSPPRRDPFAWLDPRRDQLSVFVPVLLGAGIVASGLAWVVEHISEATAEQVLEHRLAGELAGLEWPQGGLLAHDETTLP